MRMIQKSLFQQNINAVGKSRNDGCGLWDENSYNKDGRKMIKVVLITAVALMSGCGTSAQFYENRVVEEDVVCPIGSSAYHLPGVVPPGPNYRRDIVCMPDEAMRQTATAPKPALPETKSSQEKPSQTTVTSKSIMRSSAQADKPEWKVGNEWRYGWKVVDTSGTLTREVIREDTFSGVPSYVVRVGKNENFYTKDDLGLIATMSGGKVTLKRDASYEPLSWPLEVGKEWKSSFTLLEGKVSQTYNNRIVVAKVETIEVPAGIYEAFKIEVYSTYSGNLLSEYWYSPQVKWFVKARIYQDGVRDEELLSFKVD